MIKPLILKNNLDVPISVIGISIEPAGAQTYSQYSFQTLRSSDVVMQMIRDGNVIVNDGSGDLSPDDGFAYVVNEVSVNPIFLGDGMTLPVGDTGSRPVNPNQGVVRFNTSLNALEIFVANAWITFDGNIAQQKKVLFAQKSDIQYLSKTANPISFSNFPRMDSIYAYSNSAFVLKKAGWYRVTINLAFDIDANKETTTESYLTIDNNVVSATKAYTYSAKKGNGEASTIIATFLNVAANASLKVMSRVTSGSAPDNLWSLLFPSGSYNTNTIPDACRAMIEEID